MTDLGAILDGFKTRIETISGLRAYDGWPDSFSPPGVIVLPTARQRGSMNGAVELLTFELTIAVQPGTLRTAQDKLYAYASKSGDDSIEAALLAEPTLGGSIDDILDIQIDADEAFGTANIGGVAFPSAVLRVEVIG
jgi:hypothetical protein